MHHSTSIDPEMEEALRKQFGDFKTPEEKINELKVFVDEAARRIADTERIRAKLGPTGEYPGGQLTKHDEGELRIAVGTVNGKVAIDFGTPVAWIGFSAKQARALAKTLKEKAQIIEEQERLDKK